MDTEQFEEEGEGIFPVEASHVATELEEVAESSLASVLGTDPGIDPSDADRIILESLPYHGDSKKARYLAYRACGFAYREACQLTPVHEKSVFRWRAEDPVFKAFEERIPLIRKDIGSEYIMVDFLRNYKAILEKDFKIIMKAVNGTEMSPQEHQYLMKARSHYTPTQLETLQVLMGKAKRPDKMGGSSFNFTQFVLTLARNNGEMKRIGGPG